MVHGLVWTGLLRFFTRQKSDRARNRHTPRLARRIMAASNQSLARRASQQLTACLSVHRLWIPHCSGNFGIPRLGVRDIAPSGTHRVAVSRPNSDGMITAVIGTRSV